MPKIVFIGAGSLVFSQRLMLDLLSFPKLQESTFALVDIDEARLAYAKRIAERIIREGKFPAKVIATTDRKQVLPGADYVITMFLTGGIDVITLDIEIPLQFGVNQCIGDTLGPGGVFRALRTIPVLIDLCRDMEQLCPDAWLLNYTNPMAMLCWAVNAATKIKSVGLCHSVQGTAGELARYISASLSEISYWVAGINHQAWFLEFKRNGKNAYPLLREKVKLPEIYNSDTTRIEMFNHLGYFVTESSGHNSEYNPWFRKRPDLIAKYMTGGSWNGGTGFILHLYGGDRKNYDQTLEKIATGKEPLDFTRSHEYGSYIINSLTTGEVISINGNVQNNGMITNLPARCCIEVPCQVSKERISPCYIGDLPPHLAAINNSNIAVQELAVRAALTGNTDDVYYAIALDPLTAAVLSLSEIKDMVNLMFEKEKDYLPQFKLT